MYTKGDLEGTIQIEYDDVSLKTFFLTPFGVTDGRTLRFDEKSFFNTSLGFTRCWEYKPTNANHTDSPGAYTSVEILFLSTIKDSCTV